MKKLLKILIAAGALVAVVQIPFIYRYYQTGKLAGSIEALNATRTPNPPQGFRIYKGVIHVHSSIGGHSTGKFEELIDAAAANELDFVVMTEHVSEKIDTGKLTLNGNYGKTLFIGGQEFSTADGDRLLAVSEQLGQLKPRKMGTEELLTSIAGETSLALVTYPERFNSWGTKIDGIEVFSMHTAAKQMNPVSTLFDLIWTFRSYPELMLARSYTRPDEGLADFDAVAADRKALLFAGNDAHSNIGLSLFSDETGGRLFSVKLDSYSLSFRVMRLHVLIPAELEFSREVLIDSLKKGRAYVGFDILGDPEGFSFTATAAAAPDRAINMGDEVPSSDIFELAITTPVPSRIVLLKDGVPFAEQANTRQLTIPASNGPGVYRVEVYLDTLGPPFDKMPWILSNPIYIR